MDTIIPNSERQVFLRRHTLLPMPALPIQNNGVSMISEIVSNCVSLSCPSPAFYIKSSIENCACGLIAHPRESSINLHNADRLNASLHGMEESGCIMPEPLISYQIYGYRVWQFLKAQRSQWCEFTGIWHPFRKPTDISLILRRLLGHWKM